VIEQDVEAEELHCVYCDAVLRESRERARARRDRLICDACWVDGMDLDF
jgi:hypothetical protein